MFLGRMLAYLLRKVIYRCLGLLRFFSKPGSRVIVPVGLIAFAILARQVWHEAITTQLQMTDPGFEPETYVLDVVLFVIVAGLIVVYLLASKLLGVLLGAFPVAMMPLPPMRDLKPTETTISPAVVRIVVPPLPRQRR